MIFSGLWQAQRELRNSEWVLKIAAFGVLVFAA
jgi:hypothetical protein